MEHCRRYGVIVALCLLLMAIFITRRSECRELRPSEHGLDYQDAAATRAKSPEMESFFGATAKPAQQNLTLPEAMNMSSQSWWSGAVGGGRRGEGRDQLREGLLVASVVCGITGVALLVAALIVLVQLKTQKSSSPST